MPKLGIEHIAFQFLTGRSSSGCLKVLSFWGLGDRFSIYFELLICTTGSACSMICICFSHDVIISHPLSLRRITAVIMTAHSRAPGKTQQQSRVPAGAHRTRGGLGGTPGDARPLCDSFPAELRMWGNPLSRGKLEINMLCVYQAGCGVSRRGEPRPGIAQPKRQLSTARAPRRWPLSSVSRRLNTA